MAVYQISSKSVDEKFARKLAQKFLLSCIVVILNKGQGNLNGMYILVLSIIIFREVDQ